MADMIKVMVVDDSEVQRALLTHILSKDENIKVVSVEKDGYEALNYLENNGVDIILMDINMPGINGFETSKKILELYAIPIIIISATWDIDDAKEIVKSMELGVVATLKKPESFSSPTFEHDSKYIIQAVKDFYEIKIVRRFKRAYENIEKKDKKVCYELKSGKPKVVYIGSSSGGPPALKDVLIQLKDDFFAPIIVTQHMTDGFSEIFAQWLNDECKIDVIVPKTGDRLEKSKVYIVPTNYILSLDNSMIITLEKRINEKPGFSSINDTLKNLLKIFDNNIIGIILSGMGSDGVDQLAVLHSKGGITIAQDEASSLVYGMPKEAVNKNAVDYSLNPEQIGELLTDYSSKLKES